MSNKLNNSLIQNLKTIYYIAETKNKKRKLRDAEESIRFEVGVVLLKLTTRSNYKLIWKKIIKKLKL